MSKKLYILYDGRACGNNGTDDALVLCTAQSEAEALQDADMFGETACYSYDAKGKTLTNEKWEWDTDVNGRKI